MDCPQTTGVKCSQSPQQPKVKTDCPQTTAGNCSQPPQQPEVQMEYPQTTAANCSEPPQQPNVQMDRQPHSARQEVHNRLKQNLILEAALTLPRSPKLRMNSISTRLFRQ